MSERRSRRSIHTRIFVGFGVVLASFGAVSVTSLVQHERTAEALRVLHDVELPLTLTVVEANAMQAVLDTLLGQDMSERDRSVLNAARQVRPATLRRAFHSLDRAAQLDLSDTDRAALSETRAQLERVRDGYDRGNARYDALFEALSAGEYERGNGILEEIRAEEREIQRDLRDVRRALRERIATVSADAAEGERQAAILLGALTVLALLVGVVTIWRVQRMLSPLQQLMERVAAVARGDLSAKIEAKTDDELGRLATEFERMVEALAARDARLREATEAQLRLQRLQQRIVADLSAAVVVVDAEGAIRTANPAAEAVLGLGPDSVGAPLADTAAVELLAPLADAVDDVSSGNERAVLLAVPVHDGGDRAVNVVVTPFGAGDDTHGDGAVLVVAEDVTEELRTKARLIHTERLAAIGRMAAHVTHEVRNPLSSIGLNVEMLEEELFHRRDAPKEQGASAEGDSQPVQEPSGSGQEAKALLRAIQREIDRLTGVTEEYLRLARLPQPRLEPDDVGELVESVARFTRPEMEKAGIALEVDVEPSLPPVALDEPQLRQALLNLLRNAREAMSGDEDRDAAVRIRVDGDRGGVRVRVSDQGPGIPDAERARMFDLFYTTKERGTGLGLPLTQQIVVAHGGRIECESGPGAGTTFELWFPAARPPSPAVHAADAGGPQ